MLALLFALQAAVSLGDVSGSYCLETGYCRAPDDGYQAPPPGALFLAAGLVGFGVITLSRRARS